jgi:CheY-like chemotaxis protein/two-component sensor histidine kinase
MLAHELRNPLAAIRTGIYLLEQRAAPEDTETQETCALLERQMRHLSRLLDDLLDVSRISRGKIHLRMEPVDLVQALRHAAAASQCLLELNRHTLSLALPAEPVWVEGDPVRLEQVVTNLLQNAIKYMNPGGQVWLSLAIVPQDPSAPGEGAMAEVRVRDSGIGMSPVALLHIFDLFVQGDPALDRAAEGLGIGLALVRSLVQLHHGRVQAYSEGPGRGSEFRVLLPLRTSGPTQAAPAQALATTHEGKRILLVEDNVAAAVTLTEVLELWGHEVTTVHTGEAALAAAASPPEVALLDIGLPDMDGYEVARRLRSLPGLQDALLVALTGYGQPADRQLSQKAGFDHHLVKPVDLEELRRIIATRRPGASAP